MNITFKGTPIMLAGLFSKNGEKAPDFRPTSHFGEKYGVLIANGPMQGLLARAVVIISPEGKVVYAELVSEVTNEPNYEEVLKVINPSLAQKNVSQ